MTALIIVDLQNDFLPGGALGVLEADKIINHINALTQLPFNFIAASKDWHPKNHISFASFHNKTPGDEIILDETYQILWPDHCVQDTFGSEFPSNLHQNKIQCIIYKGIEADLDSYSAFFDNEHKKATALQRELKKRHIKKLFIAGLTTDYCVKYTVLDALEFGYVVYVVKDACKAVNLQPNDEQIAFEEMKKQGALVVNASDVVKCILK